MPIKLLSILVLLLLPSLASAQDAPTSHLTQEMSSPETRVVGQAVDLKITIVHPAETQIIEPESLTQGRWELVSEAHTEEASPDGGLKSVYDLTYSVFRAGETTLGSMEFNVISSRDDSVSQALSTQPITLKFVSNIPQDDDDPQFNPPQPPVSIWVEDLTLAYVGGGFVGLGLLGLMGFFWTRRRKVQIEVYVPPPPPHEVALNKLGALAGSELIEHGQYMVFYVRLSEAIREYLGQVYGFPGTEFTSREIQSELREVQWPRGLALEDVAELLQHSDLVKFSGIAPSASQGSEALRQAFTIVELTRPRAVPEPTTTPESTATTELEATDAPEVPTPLPESQWAPTSEEE